MTYEESKRPQLSAAKRALLEKRLKGRRVVPTPDQLISSRTARESAPLSFAQQRLWFLWQMDPEGFAYNVSAAFSLKGQLDLKALERSFNEIIRRHESLRTSFRVVNAEPRQIISPALVIQIPLEDLQHLPEDARHLEAMRLASESSQQPFDLERLPLLRIRVLRLSADEYVLLVVMHHIVTDGWSQGLMVEELGTLYQAYSRGRESTLAELEIQYGDYAEWQRGWLSGEVLEQQVGYWKKQLSGSRFMLELPTDHIRPPVQTQRGTQIIFDLSPEVSEKLRALSREHEVTLFMTLLAAFQVLLSRYTHQTDIIVGTPIANRTRREIEHLIGFFVNTLVLRSDLSGAPGFRELLHRVGEMTEAAYAHQEVPFEKLVEELQPERDMSRSPLFQVMFALQNAPMQSFELPGLNLGPMEFEHGATGFDLECHLWEYEQSLRGMLVYSTDLFEEATMRRLIRHFQTLLDEIVAHPDERITRLQMLTRAEERQLLDDWNDTTTEPYDPAPAHQLFAAQAATTPDHIALRFDEATLTYSELNARANRLAHYLRRRGIGAESIVGICLERSVEMIVSVLGVLKAGGAYLPLDPDYPSERLAFMIEDARASLLLTQENLRERLSDAATEIISLEHLAEDLSSESARNPSIETTSDNLACVIYTSGSTGRPKGVMMPHGPLVNLLRYQIERSARVCHAPRTLQFASLSFDVSFQEIFTTLCAGGELLLIREDERRDINALLRLLRGARVERLFLPFVALQHLAETSEREALLPASLREVITAGEQLKVTPYLKSMFEKLAGCVLDNQYGPSESHVASAFRLDGEARHWPELPPIGQAIANTQLYALDEEMQLVPVGVTGELFIGGDCLSRGYLHRAGATAEKFIPHPFSTRPGARLYRTGDLVRRLPDGELEFLGRRDSQVKMRGYRIEPGEVEAALALHPAVSEAVVMIHTDGAGERRLVAYLVGAKQGLNTGELRQFLSGKLPDYMVPSAFLMMDQFPLTPSGKVNRRALPVPEMLPFERERAYLAPHTRTEKMLAEIWAGVLGIKQVGIEDNFFALGGHSLLATQVLSRARQAFEVEIPLRRLFKQPTIEGLAQYIEEKARESQKIPQPIAVRQSGKTLPLSFAQQRLWFIDQLFPQSAAYNLPSALRLEGALDLAALQRSFNEIIRRHESLRTTFSQGNGRAVQVVAEKTLLDIPLLDLRTLAPEQRDAETVRLASEEAQRPFDLQRGPLVRALLLRLEEREHILLVTMHHIVTDGWSLGILVRELGALYQAYSTGQEPMLADLSLQYGDYAEWQREWMSGERLERELEYWRRQLSGSSLVLELPTDRARPPVQRQSGAQFSFAISEETTRKLYELSHDEDVTLFMTLLAVFQVLLSRYTHQQDIIVGSPIANRTRAEVEDLIGFFVNTLVLRTDLSGDPEFREMMRRVREVTLGGYEHQEVPFEKLVEELQPERDMSRSPLFQVMFMLQNEPVEALEMTGLRIRHVPVESTVEMFDLTLIMNETGDGLRGAMSYSTDLFDETTIRRMCEHFENLLEGIVADPQQHLSELPLLTEKEQEQLLVQWNDTHFERREEGQLLQHMFEAQVARTPEGVALVYEGASLKYGELDQRANKLANYLARMGVGPEAIVGVMMERSLDLVVGLLGVLKAGGAYLPLDPQYPQERLGFMLEDSGAQVVLTEAKLLDRLNERTTRAVCLDEDWETIAAESDRPQARMMSAGHPAYVIYTSGSTGQPKGVLIPHRAICNRLDWGEQVFPLNETDRILQSTTISFDVSVWEFFAPLIAGAGLVLPKPGGHQEIAYLADLIEREKITILNVVPSLLQVLMEDERFRQFDSLRQVFVGGEAMPVGLPARFFSQSSAELYNLYGPTETTIDATWWQCSPDDAERRSIPIGRPIGNLQIYLLDQYLHLVPAGVAGELYIGGEGLARGYLNRPELTAEKFIPHPYGTSAGARLYRTGDLARYLPDGQLEFLRRVDDQVKIRGFRIETGEIEAALLKHPSVRNAIVRVSPSVPAQQRLVAYVITPDNGEVTSRELRDFLTQRLPEYLIPSSFMSLDKFPLTPSGKVDVRALPLHAMVAQDKDQTDSIQYTPTEEMLARVWTEILRVERVQTHDNFFDLGGHSLLAMQLMSRVREEFGVDVSVRQLFEAPTLAGLAHHLEASQQRAGQVRQPPLVPAPRVGGLPLSFAQQRLWFLEQMRPGSPAYNIPVALRLKGQLDVLALEQSLNEIVRRHEALRTNFRSINGEPVQVVQAFEPESLAINDLSAMPYTEREALVRQLSTAEAGRPFQLESGRMIRAALLRLRADEHVLFVTLHHIVADDWSFGILIRELSELYRAFSSGQPSTLPELSIQYADFAAWQRAWLAGEVLEGQLAYWRKQLAGAPPLLALPTDRPRPAVQSARGGVEMLWLDARLTAALRQLSLEEGVTLFMTLLAVFQVLLSRYTHQQDIIVGSPIANRTRAEVEDLIGFFVNTLVLRTDLSGDPEFREMMRRVREVTLGGYEHQEVPFEKLVEELQPERSLGHMPLVQVIFTLQNAPQDALAWPGLTMSGLEADNSTAKFDLVLNVSEIGERLGCALRYSTDLFDPATMKRMLGHFQTLLAGIVNHPDCRINALPLMNEDERRRLLNEWRPSDARRFPQDAPLHQMFEAQVEQRPAATALVFGDERLSYAELNRRANRLAHYLRTLGVGPESRVGLLLERSTEMVVALLAILKAGGAYVPFDSSYPQERLDFMLADAGLSVLLTVRKLADGLSQPNMRVMLLDDDAKEVALQPEYNPQSDVRAENLAYVIYTSGSTGQPKGVLVSHAQVARLFKATEEWFDFDGQDVWTLFHSYAFDFSVWELWGALLYGGKLVIVSYEVSREPEEFYRLLCLEAVTVLNQTPSAFRQLIAAEQSLGFNRDLALRLVIFGGEALELHTLKPWFELHGDEPVRLVNMYGITETTVHVTYRPLTMADVYSGAGSRIGRPIPDLQVYVLDRELQPVPVGIEGEMYIGGDGLARGYHNRPELSAERFVPDPFDALGGARLYRSGDLARYLPSGDLEYTGRGDQQVKIRGYRIEPGEIEIALADHESVSQAVVVAREDTPGDKRLIAYLLTRSEDEETSPGVEELQNFLRQRLPEQMIPAAFVMLDSLPLTAHGKIDRRALPAPGHERPQLEQAYRPPHGTLEMLLAEMWREVLGLGQIGAEDNFFNLGGDSIKGAVFINRLQERLGEIVHVVTIFNHSTIRGLAQYLEDQYAEAVARVCGKSALARASRIDGTTPEAERVDERRIAEAKLIITPLPARAAQEKTARSKNSQAIFVLSAPRSGSTLFRVMLAGHPKLFAPPELELLSFNTLEERRNAFKGGDSFWLEGALRAIMEIKGYDAAQAKSIMQSFEERGLTTQEFYRQMQSWLVDRRLVDKTPSYALHPSILQRAEEDFDDALYIHLLRHPLGMIRSFEEAKLDQIFFRYEHPFSRKELAELIWLISNQNILNFLSRIPPRRHHLVRFEDLLDQPENIMREVCEFLGINLHPDMLQPYQDKERRMTDGIHAESRMLGDVKFHQYTGIDARTASRWQEYATGESLGHPTLELADTLDYRSARRLLKDAPPPVIKPKHAPQSSPPIINIQTGGAKRPLFFVHPGAGDPSDYVYLSRRLGEDQPFYGLPGFDSQRPDASIEERAARSISALREIQPAGPYLLGGWSFGALIAFEVAQQLRRSGEEIALLTLLDPMSPSTAASSNAHNLTVTSDPLSAAVEIAALIGWDAEELFDNLAQVGPTMRLGVLYEQAQTTSLLPPGVTLEKFSKWLLMYHAKLRCALSYRPQTYPLKINIFQASDEPSPQDGSAPPENIDKPFEIWRRLCSQPVNIVLVPGSHHTMVQEPHVEALAAHLKSILETASWQI